MIKLFFGNTASIISTVLMAVFALFFGLVLQRRTVIIHWGILVLFLFVLGLCMSVISGIKDKTGTPLTLIPAGHWVMTALCILGGLSFLTGMAALFIRKQSFWQIGFFTLSAIIIIKIILTESFRITDYFKLK